MTAEWRSAPAARPEVSLIGNYYESNPVKADMVVVAPDSWIFAGTGLAAGDRFAEMVQNEYDRVTPEVSGHACRTSRCCATRRSTCRGRASFADVTYYTAPSEAGVFATGTLWWERQLGPLCRDDAASHTDQCHIRRITANVLEAFVAGPAGAGPPVGLEPGRAGHPRRLRRRTRRATWTRGPPEPRNRDAGAEPGTGRGRWTLYGLGPDERRFRRPRTLT